MTTKFPRIRSYWRRISMALFVILVCFWLIKLVYCGIGLFKNGIPGVETAIIHGAQISRNPQKWGNPRWGTIALQYGGIAILTFLFGLDNWRTLRRSASRDRRGRVART